MAGGEPNAVSSTNSRHGLKHMTELTRRRHNCSSDGLLIECSMKERNVLSRHCTRLSISPALQTSPSTSEMDGTHQKRKS